MLRYFPLLVHYVLSVGEIGAKHNATAKPKAERLEHCLNKQKWSIRSLTQHDDTGEEDVLAQVPYRTCAQSKPNDSRSRDFVFVPFRSVPFRFRSFISLV